MNVHKRCKENVANTCGINPRHMADILQEMVSTSHTREYRYRYRFRYVYSLPVLALNTGKIGYQEAGRKSHNPP
jgi:hypothetical protein